MDKKEIRKLSIQKRNAMSETERAEYSSRICAELSAYCEKYSIKKVLAYAAYGSEVNLDAFIQDCFGAGITVYLPKVLGDTMEFFRVKSFADLVPGYKGIREPQTTETIADFADTLLVFPGAAFDFNRNRIGYGGGFYDAYFKQNGSKITHSVAVCFSCQTVDAIPADIWDQKPKKLLTENGFFGQT